HLATPRLAPRVRLALAEAARVFTVSDSLRRLALAAGVPDARAMVVGNGVDASVFYPVDRAAARQALGLPAAARVLVTVGGLVERKGFHRVIALLPRLRARLGDVRYLVVGGASAEGDWRGRLEQQVRELDLGSCVHFLGSL